jgi:hypothetical protein
MRVVTLQCRECESTPTFATEYSSDEVADMQSHMDVNFVARCGDCFACDWEVTEIRRVKGALNVSNRSATRNISMQ